MQKKISISWLLLLAAGFAALAVLSPVQALPYRLTFDERQALWNPNQYYYPAENTQNLIDKLISLGYIHPDSEKRSIGLDLGLSRGYSGAQEAKHMMGMAAAANPYSPGRKRRSLAMA